MTSSHTSGSDPEDFLHEEYPYNDRHGRSFQSTNSLGTIGKDQLPGGEGGCLVSEASPLLAGPPSSKNPPLSTNSPPMTYFSFPDPDNEPLCTSCLRCFSEGKARMDALLYLGLLSLTIIIISLAVFSAMIPFPQDVSRRLYNDDELIYLHQSRWVNEIRTSGPQDLVIYSFFEEPPVSSSTPRAIDRNLRNLQISSNSSQAIRFFLYAGALVDVRWNFIFPQSQISSGIIRGQSEAARFERGEDFKLEEGSTGFISSFTYTVLEDDEYYLVLWTESSEPIRGNWEIQIDTITFSREESHQSCSGNCTFSISSAKSTYLLFVAPHGLQNSGETTSYEVWVEEQPAIGKYVGIFVTFFIIITVVLFALIAYCRVRTSSSS